MGFYWLTYGRYTTITKTTGGDMQDYKYANSGRNVKAFKLHEKLQFPYEPDWFRLAMTRTDVVAEIKPTAAFGGIDPLRQSYVASCKIYSGGATGKWLVANEGDYIVCIDNTGGKMIPCPSDFFEAMFTKQD